jgi:hypothetical protein
MQMWVWLLVFGTLAAFATVRYICVVWCLIQLRRKWRSVPELWGIDWLDVVYRIERELGVTVTASDFEVLPADERIALTAGRLWEMVATKIRASGAETPADGWERFVAALSKALQVKSTRVTPASRLYADLGMLYGLE